MHGQRIIDTTLLAIDLIKIGMVLVGGYSIAVCSFCLCEASVSSITTKCKDSVSLLTLGAGHCIIPVTLRTRHNICIWQANL